MAVEALAVADCCGREQEALLLHGGKYTVYMLNWNDLQRSV